MNMQHIIKIGGIVREVKAAGDKGIVAGEGKLFAMMKGEREIVKHAITGRFMTLRTIKNK